MIIRSTTRPAVASALCLALAGCSAADGTPVILDGSLIGVASELANPGSTYKARQATDDGKCRELGFTPGTDGYGNCRLKLSEIRAINHAAAQHAAAATRISNSVSNGNSGLSLMCKDAIARRDNGGTQVFC